MTFDTDIFISGAGLAGMMLAARLSARGFRVIVCDPSTPPEGATVEGSDLRSTAYLEPSCRVLEQAGVWDALAPHATPLAALQVIDSDGWPPTERARRTFQPGDLGLDTFGRNIPNWRAHLSLMDVLKARENVDLRLGVGFSDLVTRDDAAFVTLTDGTRLRARLVIGADGRNSPVRAAAEIDVTTRRYGQKAFAFAVTHDLPHDDVSTEIYNSGGAFTTVPLVDHEGQPASAIVWMNAAERSRALAAAPAEDFAQVLNDRSLGILGRMTPVSPIRSWPIITQTAHRVTARRTVILAEAAHVLPPIGAQGLNTSIADIAALSEVLGDDPGDAATLDRYARGRLRDMRLRAGAIDLFNRVCQSGNPAVQATRRAGLAAVHDIAPLRQRIMMAGMGGAA
ncbi:FAD-dependent monooxygenase [Palleronia pelagia]|uniref:2-octaprenyl-6-methoxyphenol hydroxylase n=1 Tax=Palleronia pelagia TaxID=387096 RepID=A0A1H8KRV7_9RHOB|nr:FAD-dependent monooxygenase [Palleronia pelagia]SEN95551.1 2-octaprenyl-6-methoxyphenol hydroxylase [Palleronia pelagia]